MLLTLGTWGVSFDDLLPPDEGITSHGMLLMHWQHKQLRKKVTQSVTTSTYLLKVRNLETKG